MSKKLIPSKIKIGYTEWRLVPWYEDAKTRNSKVVGLTDSSVEDRVIYFQIQEDNPLETFNTLIHECFHALLGFYGHTTDGEEGSKLVLSDEEEVVFLISNLLTQLYAENPQLVSYMNFLLGYKK